VPPFSSSLEALFTPSESGISFESSACHRRASLFEIGYHRDSKAAQELRL
jgi:hypothetical protein